MSDKRVEELFNDGLSYQEIADMLGLTYKQVNHALHRVRTRQGREERRPRVDDAGDKYIITSGQRSLELPKDTLREIKALYCGDTPLTINQVCRKLNIPRRDFHLIKTAFNITHDDVPYIDDDLDQPIDELVSQTIEQKKHQYFIKLQQQEIVDLKREVEQYRKRDYQLTRLHELVMADMADFSTTYTPPKPPPRKKGSLMLEVPIVDLHLGKLAWAPESGENYDYKIADKRFMYVVNEIAARADGGYEKVVMPIGNDFFNFDTWEGTTSLGTRQDNDLRWQKLFVKGTRMLIKAIDTFSQIAPVEVMLVPGNHDKMTSFYAIEHLGAWYKNSDSVQVNTSPAARKYVEFGSCLIGFTHGDKEKKRLQGIMQVEAAEAWGRTKYREFHAAHFHSEKVNEGAGIILRNLSSITGTDAWHYESGYVGAIAKSQSFVWDKDKGLREIWMTTLEGV